MLLGEEVIELSARYSFEELAHALYLKGESKEYSKITDKTKWREPVLAEKLGHKAHAKISAGAGSDEYGSDAFDESTGKFAEYKSKAIVENELRNLYQTEKGNGKRFAPLTVTGVYNGAYKESAIEAYSKIDHYFGVFYKEVCLLIIKVKTEEVIRQLRENNAKRKPGATTNLNSVKIGLNEVDKYDIVYDVR